jgi:hypothetical protein
MKPAADLRLMRLLSARIQRLLQGYDSWSFRFLYVAMFEPGKYLVRQVVFDLAGICEKGHATYERHCVKGWHLREQDGFGYHFG